MTRYLLFAGTLVFLLSVASAQSLQINAPENRSAEPGTFVTLVFHLESSGPLNLSATAFSEQGWTILRQPGDLELNPNERQPVAITVNVPDTAEAEVVETITLVLATPHRTEQATVQLRVSGKLDFALDAPRHVVLNGTDVPVTVVNRGNIADEVTLTLYYQGEAVEARTLVIAAQTEATSSFGVTEEGNYTLSLTSLLGAALQRSFSTFRFGVPPLSSYTLEAEARARLTLEGAWETDLSVEGPLSDFVALRAYLSLPDVSASFLEVGKETWAVRAGRTGGDPFGIGLASGRGLAGRYRLGGWTLASGVSLPVGARSGYFAVGFEDEEVSLGAGLGLRSGKLEAGLRAAYVAPDRKDGIDPATAEAYLERASGTLRYLDDSLSFRLELEGEGLDQGVPGLIRVDAEGNNLLSENGQFGASIVYRLGGWAVSARSRVPTGSEAQGDWQLGLGRATKTERGDPLGLQLTLGSRGGALEARLRRDSETAIKRAFDFGVFYDSEGVGAEVETRFSDERLSGNAKFILYPFQPSADFNLSGGYAVAADPLTGQVGLGWDVTGGQLSLNGRGAWAGQQGRLDLTTNLSYAYAASSAAPWSFTLSLTGDYAWEIPVPEPITTLAGGRQVGRVNVSVRAGGVGLPGVEIRLGEYRVLTDGEGGFTGLLPAGEYEVELQEASLPITYRLETPADHAVTVETGQERTLEFIVAETAVVQGRVLLDSDGDGEADDPAQGVRARLQLTDARGLALSTSSAPDGRFTLQRLAPGPATLRLSNLPVGSGVVGASSRNLILAEGEVSETIFLVRLPEVKTRTFSAQGLRVRRVVPELERAPPGSGPQLSVTVQGEPDTVGVTTAGGTVPLAPAGDEWVGRLPLEATAPSGPYTFTVRAQRGQERSERQGSILIDSGASALVLEASGPVPAGASLKVTVKAYFGAETLTLYPSFGGEFELSLDEAGTASFELPIPTTLAEDLYTLRVVGTSAQGATFEESIGFKVNAP